MRKFSVRDLFWLVLVAAILCGWWLEHRETVRLREDIANRDASFRKVIVFRTGSPGTYKLGIVK